MLRDLRRARLRQRRPTLEIARHFEGREVLPTMLDQAADVSLVAADAVLPHDQRLDLLAARLVLDRDGGGLGHGREGGQYTFYLPGRDVLAAPPDCVFHASDDGEIPALIHPEKVARPEPVTVKGGGCRFGPVVVALEN